MAVPQLSGVFAGSGPMLDCYSYLAVGGLVLLEGPDITLLDRPRPG